MPKLILYHKTGCPYSQKVFRYLDSRVISVPTRNISGSDAYRQELISTGGKQQVPCLFIDGRALYESDDIIQWFKDNEQKIKKS